MTNNALLIKILRKSKIYFVPLEDQNCNKVIVESILSDLDNIGFHVILNNGVYPGRYNKSYFEFENKNWFYYIDDHDNTVRMASDSHEIGSHTFEKIKDLDWLNIRDFTFTIKSLNHEDKDLKPLINYLRLCK